MPDAVNPSVGTVVLEQPLRSQETHEPAREAFSDLLKRRTGANPEPEKETPAANVEPKGEGEPKTEAKPETVEQPDDGSIDMPEFLPDFAKAVGIDEDALLENLKVTRKINGQDRTFTLKEALAGTMMEGDYRQKTTELAEQRRQVDAAVNQIAEHWKTRLETLDAHIRAAEQFAGKQPDLALAQSDPASYVQALAVWNQQQQAIQAAKGTLDAERNRGQQEMHGRLQAYRGEQLQRARETIPELADPVQAEKFKGAMYSAASHYGLSGDELTQWLNGAFDHRHLRILADAIKYRTGTASLDKGKLNNLPKVRIKPLANTRSNSPQAQVDQALSRVRGLPSKSQDRRDATRELFKAKLAQRSTR